MASTLTCRSSVSLNPPGSDFPDGVITVNDASSLIFQFIPNMTTFATIMDKLKATEGYPTFIRHKNGDILDNRAENLEAVLLRDAFTHINDWKVDWVCYVTELERTFLVDMLTPTPEVYDYIKWRAEKEETGFDLSPSFFKFAVHRGIRNFFGSRTDATGGMVEDLRNPGFLEEYRAGVT